MPPLFRNSFLAAILLAVTLGHGDAAARSCRQIEGSFAGGGKPARAYDRAIAAQRAAIEETRRRMRDAACNGRGRGTPACGRLKSVLPKMQANLRALQGKRAGMAGGKAQRARLRAELAANGCVGKAERLAEAKAAQMESASIQRIDTGQGAETGIRFPRPAGASAVCVRLCDGYPFPMTPTRAPVDDQSNCEASCPGTPMEVFYRRPEGDEAGMSSAATGRPYHELPAAFAFRDSSVAQPEGCGCRPVGAATEPPAAAEIRTTITERPRPAASAPGERKVRVVAPAFLPDPAEAIDLRAPGPNAGL